MASMTVRSRNVKGAVDVYIRRPEVTCTEGGADIIIVSGTNTGGPHVVYFLTSAICVTAENDRVESN